MKKLNYLLVALAIFAFVACNNAPKEEEVMEETTTEEVMEEETMVEDEIAMEGEITDQVVEEKK